MYIRCAHTIYQGRDVDLLHGLDMLRAHQACIDLQKNVLRIQGREVTFLAEHELPDKARMIEVGAEEPQAGPSTHVPTPGASSFPGSGQALGSTPAALGRVPSASQSSAASPFPEAAITTLMGLGASRELAIRTLEAAGGNLDVAASLLF